MIEHFACAREGGAGELAWRVRVPADSPLFEGHFPGRPILPAVAELALVEALAREALGPTWCLGAVPALRFRAPIAPGDEVVIELGAADEHGERSLLVRRASAIVASGRIALARRERDG